LKATFWKKFSRPKECKGLAVLENITKPVIKFYGNSNITLKVNSSASGFMLSAINKVLLQIRYSKFNETLPSNILEWAAYPISRSQKNLKPFGQTSTTPIFTVNNLASHKIDIYMRLNESVGTCVTELNVSNSSSQTNPVNLTLIEKRVCDSIDSGGNCPIYQFIDLNNCNSWSNPIFEFKAVCNDCYSNDTGLGQT